MPEPHQHASSQHYFQQGDHHGAALAGAMHGWDWASAAGLGLCGRPDLGLKKLENCDGAEADYYRGVLHWMAGQDDLALKYLENSRHNTHAAKRLAHLIQQARIHVLAIFPWKDSTQSLGAFASQYDDKFSVHVANWESKPKRLKPYDSIFDHIPAGFQPDFLVSQMVEWHHIPNDITKLDCPTLGHTADYDMHIQQVHSQLQLFDHMMVTDTTEFAEFQGLTLAPLSVYPPVFSLPFALPPFKAQPRDLDILFTGTALHPWHPDKSALIHSILQRNDLKPFFFNGYIQTKDYLDFLARSKMTLSYIRHAKAMPTRAIEALAMGSVVLAQHGSTLSLWCDEDDGVAFYNDIHDLQDTINTVYPHIDHWLEKAEKGQRIVRDAFKPAKIYSRYLRYCTAMAAETASKQPNRKQDWQKRLVVHRGWMPPFLKDLDDHRKANVTRFTDIREPLRTADDYNTIAREFVLDAFYQHQGTTEIQADERLVAAMELYAKAINLFPRNLVLRFNFIRATLLMGVDNFLKYGAEVLEHTLANPVHAYDISPKDDILSYDLAIHSFNYRQYATLSTEMLAKGTDHGNSLKKLIFAGLLHIKSMRENSAEAAELAHALDPDFELYAIWNAKHKLRKNPQDAYAITTLQKMSGQSIWALECWHLLKRLERQNAAHYTTPETDHAAICLQTSTILNEGHFCHLFGRTYRRERLDWGKSGDRDIITHTHTPRAQAKLTVVVPDLNGACYHALWESLGKQTAAPEDWELIVVDAYSEPAAQAINIADTVLCRQTYKQVYHHGLSLNQGVIHAHAPWIFFIHADCSLPETFITDAIAKTQHAPAHTSYCNVGGASDGRPFGTYALLAAKQEICLFEGFDQSATFSGILGGVVDLAMRIPIGGHTLASWDALPKRTLLNETQAAHNMRDLITTLWPDRLSETRPYPYSANDWYKNT
jgi:hypothetical protein